MSRSMWILAALFAVLAIAMIWQSETGGFERPWTKCKENLVQQMLTGACTPASAARILRPSPDQDSASPDAVKN